MASDWTDDNLDSFLFLAKLSDANYFYYNPDDADRYDYNGNDL